MLAIAVWLAAVITYFVMDHHLAVVNDQKKQLINNTVAELDRASVITPVIKQQIQAFVDDNHDLIHHIAIFKTNDFNKGYMYSRVQEAQYLYPSYVGNASVSDFNYQDSMSYRSEQVYDEHGKLIPGKIVVRDENGNVVDPTKIEPFWRVEVVTADYQMTQYYSYFHGVMIIGFVSFFVYWILFSLWAIACAYQRKPLTVIWAISFCLFNVFAYVLYRSVTRPKKYLGESVYN